MFSMQMMQYSLKTISTTCVISVYFCTRIKRIQSCINHLNCYGRLLQVGWLEFNVPFQHKTVITELLLGLGWLILLRLVIISYIYYTE